MANNNKVFFGLSNAHIVPISAMTNGVPTYDTPFAFPGAVSWGPEAEGEDSTFRADNIDYYVTYGNDGYTGDFEVARVIDDFSKEILGMEVGSNGELIEVVQNEAKPFALIVQIEGDKSASRWVYPYCTSGRPSTEHGTTEEGTVEPGTETLSITARPVKIGDKMVTRYRIDADASNYDTILTTFTLPTFAGGTGGATGTGH